MRLRPTLVLLLACSIATTLAAHDLFLKLTDFFVSPGAGITITGFNGTFVKSENAIARARVADLSLSGPAGRVRIDTAAMTASGPLTLIKARVPAAGTWVAGLSTRASSIHLSGKDFNSYLAEEGLNAVLDQRKSRGESTDSATERYAKHVKTIIQAGDALTANWSTPLGYAAEILPLANPYSLHPGDTLRVRLTVNGAPVAAGQEAFAGGTTAGGSTIREQHLRTDTQGTVAVALGSAGVWYVKFISMVRVSEPGVDYVSNWATLTFGVRAAPGKRP